MNRIIVSEPMMEPSDKSLTITLTGRDLHDAARLLSRLLDAAENDAPAAVRETAQGYIDRQILVDCARQAICQRHRREAHFDPTMFGEPAWEMLLNLYVEEDVNRLRASYLATAGGTPASTGLRWLDYLESRQLVFRRPDPTDGRAELVELTEKGRSELDSYFSETLAMGQ